MNSRDECGASQEGSARTLVLIRRPVPVLGDVDVSTPPHTHDLVTLPWSIAARSRWGRAGRFRSSAHALRGMTRERRFAKHVPATSALAEDWPFARPTGHGTTGLMPLELHTWRTRETNRTHDVSTHEPLRAHALRALAARRRRQRSKLGGFFSLLRAWLEDVAGR